MTSGDSNGYFGYYLLLPVHKQHTKQPRELAVLCNKGLSSQTKELGSCFPHLDSAVSHNRPTETNMYMQNPISRPAKDITAEIKLDLPRKHVSMSKNPNGK